MWVCTVVNEVVAKEMGFVQYTAPAVHVRSISYKNITLSSQVSSQVNTLMLLLDSIQFSGSHNNHLVTIKIFRTRNSSPSF